MRIRGKRPIPLFKLIKANPPGRYCTPKVPCRLSIPTGRFDSVGKYIFSFSLRNNLLACPFIIKNTEVIA